MKNVLVTGGMGFIGSHAVVALVDAGFNPIIFDNLSNSFGETLWPIQAITKTKIPFVQWDIRNKEDLEKVFDQYDIDVVMHFAALKSVWESCQNPWLYYENNIWWTMNLLNTMEKYWIQKIIFSGSATVYGDAPSPVSEDSPTWNVTNPYGMTKWICEKLLEEKCRFSSLQSISLRYFNPIGAHPSWLLGEDVPWIPNNIFPYIMKVLTWEFNEIKVFGNDYDTIDGTGVRDYIDIIDLVDGHVAALKYLLDGRINWFDAINLGTGRGTSVQELILATQEIAKNKIPYRIVERREWDIAQIYASVDKAKEILWWQAQYTINDSITNAIRFIEHKKLWTS